MARALADIIRSSKLLGLLVSLVLTAGAQQVVADSNYGVGTYGNCNYNSCGISVSSSGSVDVSIIPLSGTSCTLASDSVSVLTDASTGYTLQISDNDTANSLHGAVGGLDIAAVSGSAASPALLSAGHWGYRVDSAASFGSGPTSAQSNGSVPSVSFAAVPLSSASPDTITSTSGAADPAVTTAVWYGACANASQLSDTYTDSIVYTAVVN